MQAVDQESEGFNERVKSLIVVGQLGYVFQLPESSAVIPANPVPSSAFADIIEPGYRVTLCIMHTKCPVVKNFADIIPRTQQELNKLVGE
eukprot:1807672-Rhodomonas_salina.1